MNNIDLLCCSQTGSGKTLSYLIPLIASLCKPYDHMLAMKKRRKHDQLNQNSSTDSHIKEATPQGTSCRSSEGHDIVSIFKQINIETNVINEKITRDTIDARGVLPFGCIVVPSRELAQQVFLQTRRLITGSNIRAVCVYGKSFKIKNINYHIKHSINRWT